MKIQIDTKEDSSEELKKVIRLLQALVNETPSISQSKNIFESGLPGENVEKTETPPSGNMFNMFESQPSQTPSTITSEDLLKTDDPDDDDPDDDDDNNDGLPGDTPTIQPY
ncbi:hypothetical protein ACFL1H_05450 [Nanoarchaeota archaeon]